MSRIGKLPIKIIDQVNVDLADHQVKVKGKLGELSYHYPSAVKVTKEGDNIVVLGNKDNIKSKALWGLARSIISNMIEGVANGFKKTLEINGVGYRASVKGKILTLVLGYSHEIKYLIPDDITILCPKPNILEISGYDKQRVGHVAAVIRKFRPPEPYKGKGIKYSDEIINRKEGKKK